MIMEPGPTGASIPSTGYRKFYNINLFVSSPPWFSKKNTIQALKLKDKT
jgi:hypothetical protein